MNGNKLLLDTNIILYLLDGDETLVDILDGKHTHVSFISELELLSFKLLTLTEKEEIEAVLSFCTIIEIKRETIEIRQNNSLKLPDAIIAGTSSYLGIPLISADKAFNKANSLNLLFYEK